MTTSYRYRNVGPAASLALLVLSSIAVTPASAAGGTPVLTKVVEPGDPAVDLGENLLIAGFGTHPDFETVFGPGDVPARIDRQGNITFHAFATENGLPGECSFADPTMSPLQGLYRTPAGQLELMIGWHGGQSGRDVACGWAPTTGELASLARPCHPDSRWG